MADSARPCIKLNDAVKKESCHDLLLHPSLCLTPFAAKPVVLSETSEHKGEQLQIMDGGLKAIFVQECFRWLKTQVTNSITNRKKEKNHTSNGHILLTGAARHPTPKRKEKNI